MDTPSELKCNVCGKKALGVACSAFGAVSFAYCVECLQKPADAEMMFAYLYEDVSDKGEGLHESINNYYTWKDDKYISWPEYVALRRAEEGN
jgi:hypothetical protein